MRCFSSSSKALHAFSCLSLLLATWKARRFAANVSFFMRAVVTWVMACSSSEISLGEGAFLETLVAGAVA